MVEVQILGPVQAVVDGHPARIGSRRQRAILAALALARGRVVAVDALIEALWGEDEPDDARGTLQSYVSRLRRQLGNETIVFAGNGYRLADPCDVCDAATVERMRDEARAAWPSSPAQAAARFDAALALWRGPALGEFADNAAFVPDHVRFAELHRSLIDDAHAAHLDAGHHDVLPSVERTAAAEPLRERSQVLLMRALAAAGRTADALRVADRYRRHLVEQTGVDPGDELGTLERELLEGPPAGFKAAQADARPMAGSRLSVRLPRAGEFFGRDHEVNDVAVRVGQDRLVTVVGPGGIGKTRVVAELLARPGFDDAMTVELAPVALAADVAGAVAAALGLSGTGDNLLETVAEFLSIEHRLLVLDNCEHVVDGARELVAKVLATSPGVHILTTSRVRLGLAAEQVVALDPLAPADAVALYADRVARAAPSAAVDPDDPRVQRVCRRLEGMPLALELAAGRTATLGVAGLDDRLHDVLDLLDATALDVHPRHRALRAVVEWSYALLDPVAQALFDALSIFEHGFTLEAAEHVGAIVVAGRVTAPLSRLVDASLVLGNHDGGHVRYRMLEPVAADGRRRLGERRVEEAVRAAHLTWFADLAELIVAESTSPHELAAWERVDDERDNFRAALRWATSHPEHLVHAVRIAVAFARIALYRADSEIVRWVRTISEHPAVGGAPFERAALAAGARAAFQQGDLHASQELATRAVTGHEGFDVALAWHALGVDHLYRGDHGEAERWWYKIVEHPAADGLSRADALSGVALARCYAGDLAGADDAQCEMQAIAEALGSPTLLAFARYVAGEIAQARDTEHAVVVLGDAARIARAAHAEFVAGLASIALVSLLVRLDRSDEALGELAELIDLWWRTSTWPQQWTTLRLLAELLGGAGQAEAAAVLLEAAERDAAAPAVVGADATRLRALRTRLREELGDDGWRRVTTTARVLPRARVVERALDMVQRLRSDARR